MSRKGQAGYVYLIRGDHGLCKIGKSSKPERRAAELATLTGLKLEIIHAIACRQPYRLEAALHEHFASTSTGGEWFRLSEADIALVRTLRDVDLAAELPGWLSRAVAVVAGRCVLTGWPTMTVLVPVEIAEALKAMAGRNGRTVSVEACHAIERHLAEPPPVLITPPLSPCRVEDATPRRKRGRPKKPEE